MSEKYVKNLSSDELLKRLADELVVMHNDTGIDLGYWETAREVVERFYNVVVELKISEKKKVHKEILKGQSLPTQKQKWKEEYHVAKIYDKRDSTPRCGD